MSNDKKDLRNAKTTTDPDLNFTYNDLLQELEKEYKCELIQPGDITVEDMVRVTGLGNRQCALILSGKVKRGELISFRARNSKGFFVNVYRKLDVIDK